MDRDLSQELQNYEDPRNCVEQEETSTLAVESRPTEWTNEKHSLYLKSMEASFVDQLYRSLDLFGSTEEDCQSKPKSSKHKKSSDVHSGQYKVFQDGCWSKIDFMRDEPRPKNAEDPRGNPWIQRYKQAPRNSSVYHSKTSSVNQFHTSHFEVQRQDSIGSSTEVMGQNFNDEDREEENSSRIHDVKRSKTSTDDTSSNDQVVPFGLPQVGCAAEEHMSSEDCLKIIDNNIGN